MRFTYRGEEGRSFHFAGTPSSFRTPATTESKLRRFLGMIKADLGRCPVSLRRSPSTPARVALSSDAERNPVIVAKDGEAFTNSRDVVCLLR